MSSITLKKNEGFRYGEIELPFSKSLSNRALIIRELTNPPFDIRNLSNADDTDNLLKSLSISDVNIDIGAAGTNMRFLISLLSIKRGKHILTGNERMQTRPVGELVDCLRSIGANIQYLKTPGFAPLEIEGKALTGGHLKIDGSISSQFISSLLMIAPVLENGLNIEIVNDLVSKPYVEMTLGLMKHFGIEHEWNGKYIHIAPQRYKSTSYTVEPDWSSAAFWYGLVANAKPNAKVLLKGLHMESLQGDKKALAYFKQLGVESSEKSDGILIEKLAPAENNLHYNLIDEPDLFPALAYCCASLNLNANFAGLQTLNLKESNRIEAVKKELEKMGAICISHPDRFEIRGYGVRPDKIVFDTYDDHRLAMAASIMLYTCSEVTIQHPGVVSKSYPNFWADLKSSGILDVQ